MTTRMLLAYDPETGTPFLCVSCADALGAALDTPQKRVSRGLGPEASPYVAVFPEPRPGEIRNGACTWCGHQVWLGIDGVDFERAEHEVYEFIEGTAGEPWYRGAEHAARYVG